MSKRFVAVKPEESNGWWDVIIEEDGKIYSNPFCVCYVDADGKKAKLIAAALNAYENKDTV